MSDDLDTRYRELLAVIAAQDAEEVLKKDLEYGGSWKKHGGQGAFFATWRKADRLEEQCRRHGFDVFAALSDTSTSESLLDTIRDLRRYLMLIEAEHQVRAGDQVEFRRAVLGGGDPQISSKLGGGGKHRDPPISESERKDDAQTLTLRRCWRCSGFHLPGQSCPEDPGPAHL